MWLYNQWFYGSKRHSLMGVLGVIVRNTEASHSQSTIVIISSGQSNLTKGRIAAAHGRFNGIRQMASMCTQLIAYMLPWATRVHNPNGISILDPFSQFCTPHDRVSSGMSFPLKIAPWHQAIWTPSNTWFLGPIRVNTQTASRSVQSLLQDRRTRSVQSYSQCAPM